MELLDALSQTFAHATGVMAGVGPDQLDAPTPCREWTVRNLVAHTTGVVINMGRGASGRALLPDVNAVELDTDLGTQFRVETDRTLAAWAARGLEGEVDIGAGPMPVRAGIGINLLDTATHSWDVARATGQDAALPDELADTALSVARGIVNDDTRQFAGIDPAIAVAEDASATDQLVAFLGRRP
ncbi:MAG: TIGR03086 family metal-binding protein [Acidimicrobiia bacterium]